jgi:hypothetical protein
MELYFCDLCHEAVPQADLDKRAATLTGKRVVCKQCNGAMGSAEEEADNDVARPRRPAIGVTPNVAAVLSVAAILLALMAVVVLLVRVEMVGLAGSKEASVLKGRIKFLEERQAGTRDGMIARARQAGEDAVYGELERFEKYERQLGEIRSALESQGVSTNAPGDSATPLAAVLGASERTDKVNELEEQILFLQARVFELLENGNREGSRIAVKEPVEKLLVPEGNLGTLVTQLTHPDPIERVSALYALAHVKDVGVVRHVTPLLEDKDLYIRTLTARVLERMGARSSVQSLIEALGDLDAGVREATVSALRSITSQQFQFDPRGPGGERFKATKRWQAWWTENWKEFLYLGD